MPELAEVHSDEESADEDLYRECVQDPEEELRRHCEKVHTAIMQWILDGGREW